MSTENKSTELVAVETAVTNMNKLAEGLAILSTKYKDVVYDVTTPKGMAEAKAARKELAEPRINVEKIRKAAKAPILELGRKLDAEAARITKAITDLEDPINKQIVAEENRIEAERQAKIAAEQKRVADLDAKVNAIRGTVETALKTGKSADISRLMVDLACMPITDLLFQERTQDAQRAQVDALGRLQELHDAAKEREAQEERNRQLAADLERQRAEQEARDKVERDRIAAEQAAENERLRKEREAFEAEQARIRAEQEAEATRIRQEREALEAAQKAEQERKDREERERKEAADAAARKAAYEAEQRQRHDFVPEFEAVVHVLSTTYGQTHERVTEWLPVVVNGTRKAA